MILTFVAGGGVVGSAIALRWRPGRPLIASALVILPVGAQLLSLIPPLPPVAIGLFAAASFAGINIGNALWDAVVQANVPRETISRVSSYDWLISLVFMPVGFALAGPLAATVGLDTTLVLAAAILVAANLGVLAVPSVRAMRRTEAEPPPAASPAPT